MHNCDSACHILLRVQQFSGNELPEDTRGLSKGRADTPVPRKEGEWPELTQVNTNKTHLSVRRSAATTKTHGGALCSPEIPESSVLTQLQKRRERAQIHRERGPPTSCPRSQGMLAPACVLMAPPWWDVKGRIVHTNSVCWVFLTEVGVSPDPWKQPRDTDLGTFPGGSSLTNGPSHSMRCPLQTADGSGTPMSE